MTYTSREQKSVRERYIRVAAIAVAISVGTVNICVTRMHEKYPISSSGGVANKNIQRQTHLNSGGQSTLFIVILKGKELPFKSRDRNTYEMKQ
jgi:hypothetical protein